MSNRLIQFLCLLLAITALVGAAFLTRPIEERRAIEQLGVLGNSQADVSPAVSLFLQAGGPLRGLAINTLWFQVEQSKEQGQFYALDRYCRLIIDLQPNNPDAVLTEAWNLAYNVSVSVPNEDLRWIWVRKGISLLRDQGIPYNPTAASLYKELAWIFYHKIGGASDDARWYYALELAMEWQEILGLPDPTLTDAQQIALFAQVPQAPDSLEQLLRTHPEVGPLIQRFRAIGFEPDDKLLRQIGRVVMYNHARDAHLADVTVQDLPQQYDSRLAPILADPDPNQAAALDALLAYLRKSIIVHEYHMEPDFMYRLMRPAAEGGFGFGPLDFRATESHAVYWAALGIERAGGLINHEGQEQISTFNQLVLALKQMMEHGKVTIDPTTGYVNRAPDVRFAEAYIQALRNAVGMQQRGDLPIDTLGRFQDALESVLGEAVTLTYSFGKVQDANRYYQQLREVYGGLPGRPYRTMSLDDYAFMTQQQMTGNDIDPFLQGTLEQAFINLRENNAEAFDRLYAMAKHAYDSYEATVVLTPAMSRNRMDLGPWDEKVTDSYLRVLTGSGSPYLASRLWMATPPLPLPGGTLKQRAYDKAIPILTQQCRRARPPVDPKLAFPEPPGMDQFRKTTTPPPK